MSTKVLFWNVENFGRSFEGTGSTSLTFRERVGLLERHIRDRDPDLIGFSEIRDKVALRSMLTRELAEYDFAVTDGKEGIELLVGWKRGAFDQVIFTQRRDFKADNPHMRPGALISVRRDSAYLNVLYLHTDSGAKRRDYDNRQDMFQKIWSLKRTLDGITEGNQARFLVMGDLNTMGRNRSGSLPEISGRKEIRELARDAQGNEMRMLSKTHDRTWSKGRRSSNLDHALATDNLTFDPLQNQTSSGRAEVSVDGWNHLSGDARRDFIANVSDHCSLLCSVANF